MAPTLDPEANPALTDALTILTNSSKTPARQRKTPLAGPVDVICSHGYENGLSDELVDTLLDMITQPNTLDKASLTKLIRHLYPAGRVRSGLVVAVVASLGHGSNKAAPQVQAALIRWLILVYDVLEDASILSRLYAVLFNMLDTLSICAPLCHLLALITRRKHVRPYRIQALLELRRNFGSEPYLVGLLRVFKDYYPDVLVGDTTSGRGSFFAHPNPEWRDRLRAIQAAQAQLNPEEFVEPRGFRVLRRGAKRSKVSTIPEVHTSYAHEKSVTLEEVENVDGFVERLERFELPNQAVSVLRDPLLQKFLTLRPSGPASQRIESWLSAFFEEALQWLGSKTSDSDEVQAVLEAVLSYTRFTKALPAACGRFLQAYLPEWNGRNHRQIILELSTYLPPVSFSELQRAFFEPIERAILLEPASKADLLEYYTAVLRHWSIDLVSRPDDSPAHVDAVAAATYHRLASQANTLCLSLLETVTPTPVAHLSAVLGFYEAMAEAVSLSRHDGSVPITIPPALVTYLLYFSTSLATVSRLCAVLARYKRVFEETAGKTKRGPANPREILTGFNGYLIDLCNCMWRNRAFNKEDANARGCLVAAASLSRLRTYVDGQGYALATTMNLSCSPVFSALAIACFREMEDAAADEIAVRHAGPVTQHSLAKLAEDDGLEVSWQDYRLRVLQWLEARGVQGVSDLMYCTMKQLMPARELLSSEPAGQRLNR